jgi:tripartite ATP-independent transporter DctP family solute receptor
MASSNSFDQRRRTLLCGAAALTTLAAMGRPLSAHAAEYKSSYRLAAVLPKPYPWGHGADRWAELITERTEGRIKSKVYNNASLTGGDGAKEFAALRQGTIDLAVCASQNWAGQINELNLFSMPFLLPNYAAADAVMASKVGESLFARIQKGGVTPLAWGENGFRELTNSKRAVRTPADLEGLKIRISASAIMIDTFKALGANPTRMSWPDLQPALASGAVDGQENPLHNILHAKMAALGQKQLSLWNHVYDPLVFAVSSRTWEQWSKKDREIVRETALQAAREQIAMARTGVANGDSLLKQLAAEGVQITTLSIDEKMAFRKKAQPVLDHWTQSIGSDLVKLTEQVAKRAIG